jgi:DNA-directed RNA polymerase subunit RPC12/RpoP
MFMQGPGFIAEVTQKRCPETGHRITMVEPSHFGLDFDPGLFENVVCPDCGKPTAEHPKWDMNVCEICGGRMELDDREVLWD